MKKMKKIFAIALAIMLCASCLAISPAADTELWEMNGTKYETLQAAIDAAPDDTQTTIKLLADGYQWTKTELKGKNIIIDCAGHKAGGTVELCDTAAAVKGTVLVKNLNHEANSEDGRSSQVSEADVTFENCTFTTSINPDKAPGMFIIKTTVKMKNCNVTATQGPFPLLRPNTDSCKLTVEDSVLNHQGSGAAFSNFAAGSSVHVSNTKITVNAGWAVNCGVAATISVGGAETSIISQSEKNPLFLCSAGDLTIDGGTYSGKALIANAGSKAKGVVKAGTFTTTGATVFQSSNPGGMQISDGVVVSSTDSIYYCKNDNNASFSYPAHAAKSNYVYLGNKIAGATQMKAYQLSKTVAENGTFSIRLIGALDSLDYTGIGFDIVAKSASFKDGEAKQDCAISAAYGQLTGIGADDESISYTAQEIGGEYIFALIINGLRVDSNPITFTVITYAIKDGEKVAQDPVSFTIVPSECYPA